MIKIEIYYEAEEAAKYGDTENLGIELDGIWKVGYVKPEKVSAAIPTYEGNCNIYLEGGEVFTIKLTAKEFVQKYM